MHFICQVELHDDEGGLPLSPGSIGFTVSAATSKAHSIALHIPTLDLSNILSNPADPGDID